MKKSIILLTLSLVFFSCSNDENKEDELPNPLSQEGTNIYVGGHDKISDIKVATIWKNGEPTVLGDGIKNSDVNSVFTTASDVYAAGFQVNSNHDYIATIWKNGNAIDLNDGSKESVATSVFVSNNIEYVAGYINKAKYNWPAATIWINGAETTLSNLEREGKAHSLFVQNKDVYVVGYETNHSNDWPVAMIWKNGVATSLGVDGKESGANSVFVSGKNVYVAGYSNLANGSLGNNVAKIWINGEGTEITDGTNDAYLTGISVINSDVYAIGAEYENGKYVGKIWKNGTPTALTQGTYGIIPSSLYVSPNNIYITGNQLVTSNITTALFWKNGDLTIGLVNGDRANTVFLGN